MKNALLALPILALASQLSYASELDAGTLQQQINEQRQRNELIEKQLKKIIQVDDPIIVDSQHGSAPTADSGTRFILTSVRFSTSKILSEADLTELAKPLLGKEIGFQDLMTLTESINAAYRERGIFTAQAILPPQKVSNGVVTIKLVEGTVGEVHISGNANTKTTWIEQRLPKTQGDLVNIDDLQNALHRFNRVNDLQARVELTQGASFGTTDLNYRISEPQQHNWQATVDNHASKTVGPIRVGLQYYNASVLGIRDTFTASIGKTEGNQSAVLQYSVPVNKMGGRLSYTGIADATKFTSRAIAGQEITGHSGNHLFAWEQPWYADQAWKISTTMSVEFRESHSFLDKIEFVDKRVQSFPLNLSASHLDPKGSWYGALGFVRFNVREEHGNLDEWQSNWTANLARYHVINDEWALLVNTALQYSDEKFLDNTEQFNIGSVGSIRGYDLGVHSGAAGYMANFELQQRFKGLQSDSTQMTTILFLDTGGAFNHSPQARLVKGEDILTSAGFGFKIKHRQNWNIDCIFALPLNAKRVGESDLVYGHFKLAYQF